MFVRSLSLGVAAVALLSVGAQAADLIIPTTPQPIYEAAGFDWEGLYAGVRAGGVFTNTGANDTYGVLGGVVGVNFLPADPFLVGLEVSGDYIFGNNIDSTGDFFANVRAGAVVTDAALVYAIGGVGVRTSNNVSNSVYQLGGGVEFAVTDVVSVRGEVVGLGDFDGANDDFFESAKATVGVFYHF